MTVCQIGQIVGDETDLTRLGGRGSQKADRFVLGSSFEFEKPRHGIDAERVDSHSIDSVGRKPNHFSVGNGPDSFVDHGFTATK
jgi:hypothetical protein